jgi:hypothetical protein
MSYKIEDWETGLMPRQKAMGKAALFLFISTAAAMALYWFH